MPSLPLVLVGLAWFMDRVHFAPRSTRKIRLEPVRVEIVSVSPPSDPDFWINQAIDRAMAKAQGRLQD